MISQDLSPQAWINFLPLPQFYFIPVQDVFFFSQSALIELKSVSRIFCIFTLDTFLNIFFTSLWYCSWDLEYHSGLTSPDLHVGWCRSLNRNVGCWSPSGNSGLGLHERSFRVSKTCDSQDWALMKPCCSVIKRLWCFRWLKRCLHTRCPRILQAILDGNYQLYGCCPSCRLARWGLGSSL